jgi:hypothetical protein
MSIDDVLAQLQNDWSWNPVCYAGYILAGFSKAPGLRIGKWKSDYRWRIF